MGELEMAHEKVRQLRDLYAEAIDQLDKAEKDAHGLAAALESAYAELERLIAAARQTA